MDAAGAAMAAWAKKHSSLPFLSGRTAIVQIIRAGPSVAPSDGWIAKKTREKTGVHEGVECQLYDGSSTIQTSGEISVER